MELYVVERFAHGGARYYTKTETGRKLIIDAYTPEATELVDSTFELLKENKRLREKLSLTPEPQHGTS